MNKKKYLIIALVLSIIIGTAFALSILSNVFEGLIPHVSIPELIQIEASAPENVSIGAPFYMTFTVTNPNDFAVNARIYIDFTLNGALSVDASAMSYPEWQTTTFEFTGGAASCDISASENTWKFNAPQVYPDWFIKIPSGTNTYQMQFQVNIQCESISYNVWLAA